MNIETGQIRNMDAEDFKSMSPQERSKYVEVKRDLTQHEHAKMQIALYAPCGCGSGKKFKFCCYKKPASASVPNGPAHRPAREQE